MMMNKILKEEAEQVLKEVGVPSSLAAQCAEIIAKDDPTKPNLGRTEHDQHLIDSAKIWLVAKGYL